MGGGLGKGGWGGSVQDRSVGEPPPSSPFPRWRLAINVVVAANRLRWGEIRGKKARESVRVVQPKINI